MANRDIDSIYTEVTSDLETLGINNISPASPANVISQRFSEYMSEIYDDVAVVDAETDVSNASSERLTDLASRHGLRRVVTQPLRDNTFFNFKFYLNEEKKAKDITVDITKGFTIPAGSSVSTEDGIEMFTMDPAMFGPEDNTVYIRVYSVDEYPDAIVDVDSLIVNDIDLAMIDNVDPDKVETDTLQSGNDALISSSTEILEDEDIRNLLRYEFNSLNAVNEDRLNLAVRSVPGVADMQVVENYNGIGNTGVIVKPVSRIASEGLYVAVENSIRTKMIGGDTIKVIRPEYLSVFIKLAVQLKEEVADTDVVYDRIRTFAADYVNSLDQGGTLDPHQMELDIQESYKDLVELVQVTCLYINNQRALIQPQSTFEDQKFILYNRNSDVVIN